MNHLQYDSSQTLCRYFLSFQLNKIPDFRMGYLLPGFLTQKRDTQNITQENLLALPPTYLLFELEFAHYTNI
jgi:hypothetical protein